VIEAQLVERCWTNKTGYPQVDLQVACQPPSARSCDKRNAAATGLEQG